MTFSTKNVTTKPVGSAAGDCANRASGRASTTSSARNTASHGTERRVPSSASAASGVSIAHRIIPLEATKPPSEACSKAGNTRNATSCVVRNVPNRRVRASTTSPMTVITW